MGQPAGLKRLEFIVRAKEQLGQAACKWIPTSESPLKDCRSSHVQPHPSAGPPIQSIAAWDWPVTRVDKAARKGKGPGESGLGEHELCVARSKVHALSVVQQGDSQNRDRASSRYEWLRRVLCAMINHLHLPSRQSRRAVRTCLFSANAARTTSAANLDRKRLLSSSRARLPGK